jgi:hypothetical protein
MPQIPILPQQPYYTIHTSQAATSSAPTQTAEFSEAETLTAMTMTTGYPDEKSGEEVRREQAPEPQKCQQRKKICCKKQTTTQVR